MKPGNLFGRAFLLFLCLMLLLVSACSPQGKPGSPLAPTVPDTKQPTNTSSPGPQEQLTQTPEQSKPSPDSWVFYAANLDQAHSKIAYQALPISTRHYLDDPAWMGPFEIYLGGNHEFTFLPSPNQAQVAFYVTNGERPQVWVFDILTEQIVAKIDLFLTDIGADPLQALDRYSWRQKMMQWSPDGRYLAVVAGIESNEHKLLVYDFEQHEQRTLAEHVQHIGIVDWSPDSHTVVYVTFPELRPSVVYAFIWAATLEGAVLPLDQMSTAYRVQSLGWLNQNKIVLEDLRWEAPPTQLRALNVNTGEIFALYSDFYMKDFLVQGSKLLLSNIYEGSLYYSDAPTSAEQGLYLIDLLEGQTLSFTPSKTLQLLNWFPQTEQFLYYENGLAYLQDLASAAPAWELGPSTEVFPSPDGQHLLVGLENQLLLYSSAQALLWSEVTNSTDSVLWLSTGRAFVHLEKSDSAVALYIHSAEQNWEGMLLDQLDTHGVSLPFFIVD